MKEERKKIVIAGGGAAGFFAAITCAETFPESEVILLEQSLHPLGKVKISGGGRCNVTHGNFIPEEFVCNYPRGEKELLGPLHRFGAKETVEWFESRGVKLKTEADGRMFPVTNNSGTIIDCLLQAAEISNVKIFYQSGLTEFAYSKKENPRWNVKSRNFDGEAWSVLIATGSSEKIWKILSEIGLEIVPAVPSLFTFRINSEILEGLSGISFPNSIIHCHEIKMKAEGPLLITHRGLSGPAILKLSAWAARELNKKNYEFSISVNWAGCDHAVIRKSIEEARKNYSRKKTGNLPLLGIPSRLWQKLCEGLDKNWADLDRGECEILANRIGAYVLKVSGKDTFKEEFVTAGGVSLKEINFSSMESRKYPGLFFAGEVLDIDALTGGYNFQAAWTIGWIAGKNMGKELK